MEFKMPVAKRERLEELLEYLGERAEDFRKCFDVESEWCWKYADMALRGIESRDLEYAEGHHIVPRSFYGIRYTCRRVDEGNICRLAYGEHVIAHYCAAHCGIGDMQGKMARSVITMYNKGRKNKVHLMPDEKELIEAIPELELKRIFAMWPRYAKVEAEGRTHRSEDPVQAGKDYRTVNREKLSLSKKKYYQENKEKILANNKVHYRENKGKHAAQKRAYHIAHKDSDNKRVKEWAEAHKAHLREYKKEWYAKNKNKRSEQTKAYYAANRDKIIANVKEYRVKNKDVCNERHRTYYENNKAEILTSQKKYRDTNKEKIAKRAKVWREANKEIISLKQKAWRNAKKEAGYRKRKDPATGKERWVFVGLPENSSAA